MQNNKKSTTFGEVKNFGAALTVKITCANIPIVNNNHDDDSRRLRQDNFSQASPKKFFLQEVNFV